MIRIETSNEAMKRATERAIERGNTGRKLKVSMVRFRTYEVINHDDVRYTVRFSKTASGHKLASCDCPGNRAGFCCVHIAAALPVHCSVARTRREQ
jgi:hypothetical protein